MLKPKKNKASLKKNVRSGKAKPMMKKELKNKLTKVEPTVKRELKKKMTRTDRGKTPETLKGMKKTVSSSLVRAINNGSNKGTSKY